MKGVPGVMVLLSNTSDFSLMGILMPCFANSSRSLSSSFSYVSIQALRLSSEIMLSTQQFCAKQHVQAASCLFDTLLAGCCSCGTHICLVGQVSRQAMHPAEIILLPFPRHPVPHETAWNAAGSSLRVAQLHLQHSKTEGQTSTIV